MFPSFARGQNEPISDHFSLKEAFTTGNLDAVITDPATPGVPQRRRACCADHWGKTASASTR
ncbi:MAG: hypothetical protein CMP29_10605 [Roseibacillus sp.]|nr:hypothetical protein [Roseibacillus sp.]